MVLYNLKQVEEIYISLKRACTKSLPSGPVAAMLAGQETKPGDCGGLAV